jgi:hypothetical protein
VYSSAAGFEAALNVACRDANAQITAAGSTGTATTSAGVLNEIIPILNATFNRIGALVPPSSLNAKVGTLRSDLRKTVTFSNQLDAAESAGQSVTSITAQLANADQSVVADTEGLNAPQCKPLFSE